MQIVLEYISMNYITLMLLAGLIVILIANRRTKIEGIQYIYAITGLVFVLTICEYTEVWCDTYHKRLCEKISVNSKTVIKTMYWSGLKIAAPIFYSIQRLYGFCI